MQPLDERRQEPQRRLIITADDFGLAIPVNEAVEAGHREGVLTAASLMVGGGAVDDAVRRAFAMPSLAVGLHLVLVDGRPILPPGSIPDLVGPDGWLRRDLARFGLLLATNSSVRRQLRAEIDAQFAAFAQTGLPIDHVNVHRHYHLHPVVAMTVLDAVRDHGAPAIRVPWEPQGLVRAVDKTVSGGESLLTGWLARWMRRQGQRRQLAFPDRVVGIAWSGRFHAQRLAAVLERLPHGLTEIYVHPATSDHFPGSAPNYQYQAEMAALLSPAVRIAAQNMQRSGYAAALISRPAPAC